MVQTSKDGTICFMKHYFKVRIPKNEYIQNIISSVDLKEDVVYSFLKRIEFNSGFKYYSLYVR